MEPAGDIERRRRIGTPLILWIWSAREKEAVKEREVEKEKDTSHVKLETTGRTIAQAKEKDDTKEEVKARDTKEKDSKAEECPQEWAKAN